MDFRQRHNVILFSIVLDNLLDFIEDMEDELDPQQPQDLIKFKTIIESLDVEIFDKLISLNELSYKKRDSDEFSEILTKSKKVLKWYNKCFK